MRLALNPDCGQIGEFLGQYSHFGAPVTDLSRFAALCHALGDPQDSLKYIHIVGTNGKGSVAEFCAASLTNSRSWNSRSLRYSTRRLSCTTQKSAWTTLCLKPG